MEALLCLALTIYHEARGEPLDGQIAVAQVVMNRVRDPRYPDDVCSVVHQGPVNWKGSPVIGACQFKWWCDGKSDEPRDEQSMGRAMMLSMLVMADLMDDRVDHATHFHHRRSRPDWGMLLTRQIGSHHFYAKAR
jgi:spore germination cell wall hydrolase CwlJ-like protein